MLNFNRPHLTRQVFDIIRQIKPKRLLLVADGPRESKPDDARLCAEVRAIFDEIDWECEVSRNFAETNMGSFKRNSTGLSWVFETVEEAIILEDDCIPSLSFFPYCEELLERYRDDERVGVIGGYNFLSNQIDKEKDSYRCSVYSHIWGWASWRRVWQQIDLDMSWWSPEKGKDMLQKLFSNPDEIQYWFRLFESINNKERRNAWDYQLNLSTFSRGQLCTIPNVNLISNVGFGSDAANCMDESSPLQNMPRGELEFPLSHPKEICPDKQADNKIFNRYIQPPVPHPLIQKISGIYNRAKGWL